MTRAVFVLCLAVMLVGCSTEAAPSSGVSVDDCIAARADPLPGSAEQSPEKVRSDCEYLSCAADGEETCTRTPDRTVPVSDAPVVGLGDAVASEVEDLPVPASAAALPDADVNTDPFGPRTKREYVVADFSEPEVSQWYRSELAAGAAIDGFEWCTDSDQYDDDGVYYSWFRPHGDGRFLLVELSVSDVTGDTVITIDRLTSSEGCST